MTSVLTRRDVKALARSREEQALQEMLDKDNARVAEVYPWVTDLKNANIPNLQIVMAMIQTENVMWEEDIRPFSPETYVWREHPEDQTISQRLDHTGDSCAHTIVKMIDHFRRGSPLGSVKPGPNPSVSRLDKIAQWEKVVFKHCGIGGVLHPTIEDLNGYGQIGSEGDTIAVVYADEVDWPRLFSGNQKFLFQTLEKIR